MTTVVSVPTSDRLIIDGGMKTFRFFPTMPYGLIIEDPNAQFSGMSVEHGHIDTGRADRKFRVGDRLTVIPTHQEGVTNLHDEIVWARNDQVERVWRNEARGKSGNENPPFGPSGRTGRFAPLFYRSNNACNPKKSYRSRPR